MTVLLTLLLIPLTLMVLYLDVLSVAALLWHREPAPTPPQSRFAVLVPAHNEEKHLPRLLQSLAGLEYPRDLYDVHVVADNCTDDTADIARASGAYVLARQVGAHAPRAEHDGPLQLVLIFLGLAKPVPSDPPRARPAERTGCGNASSLRSRRFVVPAAMPRRSSPCVGLPKYLANCRDSDGCRSSN